MQSEFSSCLIAPFGSELCNCIPVIILCGFLLFIPTLVFLRHVIGVDIDVESLAVASANAEDLEVLVNYDCIIMFEELEMRLLN